MDDVFEIYASFCRVFCDPKRLRVLSALQDGERTVGALARLVGCTLANVSQHLRVMRQYGLVTTRRDGRTIFYRITRSKVLTGFMLMREGVLEEQQRRGQICTPEFRAAIGPRVASDRRLPTSEGSRARDRERGTESEEGCDGGSNGTSRAPVEELVAGIEAHLARERAAAEAFARDPFPLDLWLV